MQRSPQWHRRSQIRERKVTGQVTRVSIRSGASKSTPAACVCGRKKTEDLYFTNWRRLYRDRVIVKIAPHEHTTPFELAGAAVIQRDLDLREARRGRGKAYDEYWCVFDVDDHPKIPDALELARANKISVAMSSPCIELWFLIHFVDQTGYLDRKEAQDRSRAILGCDKVLTQPTLDLLVENYETAKTRAQALKAKHVGDGSAQPWSPHSTVWLLVDSVKMDDPMALFLRLAWTGNVENYTRHS